MPIENMSLPWYIGPTKAPWEAAIEGIHAGSQIRSNQIQTQRMIAESEQNLQRQETATQLKMIDLSLEGERNQLAKQAFMVRQDADLTRAKGMSEIGAYLGEATKNDKLTDPETQAGFWNLTSKYAPFVNEQTVNSMWDNTFKAAMDRKAKAEGGANATITERDMESWRQLRAIEQNAPTEEDRINAQTERAMFERMKGINQPMTGTPEVGQFTTPSGQKVDYFLDNRGNMHQVTPPHNNLSDFQRRQYAAELKTLAYKRDNGFSEKEKLSKKETPSETYDRLFKDVSAKYEAMAVSPSTAPASTSDPLGLFSK